MVRKVWFALVILALIVVPAMAADDSGSMTYDQSAVESFNVGGYTPAVVGGAFNLDHLSFKTIEYYQDVNTISYPSLPGDRILAPSGVSSAGSTDFIASYDGTTIGTGTISISKDTTANTWDVTLSFTTWDIGELTGSKVVDIDYSFGGDYPVLRADNGRYFGGSGDYYVQLSNSGGTAIPQYSQSSTFPCKVYHTAYWTHQWESTEINDITNEITITKTIAGNTYQSDVEILTPLNTYSLGSGTTDLNLLTVGNPVYIYVTDIYSNEFLAVINGDDYCWFSGTVYDVTTGSAISGATITAKQNGIAVGQESATSDASGDYSYIGVPLQIETELNATYTDYTPESLYFAPPWSQEWVFDLYMWPDGMTWNGSAIGGIAYEQGSSQGVAGATVNIWNGTWSDYTTANSVGYYIFENLTANSTYTLNASATDHTDSVNTTATTATDTFTQTNLALQGIYELTVYVRNSETGTLLDNTTVHISLSDGQDGTATNGTKTFMVNWGTYTVTASADGYYSGSEYVAVDEDATVTVNLIQSSGTGAGAYYPPHNVRFHVQDEFGNPLSGVLITAEYEESTGPIEWLTDLLGISADIEVENTTLSGTTGADGSITFSMVEVVQYEITATNATIGLSHTFLLYPKEEQYTIRFTLGEDIDWSLFPAYNISATAINDTHVALNVTYDDTETSSTNWLNFSVYYGNKTFVYSSNVTDQTVNASYIVENTKGQSYYWGFIADHDIYGTIEDFQGITLKGGTGKIVDLGLTEDQEVWYIYISMIITAVLASLFSITNVKIGVIMVPLCASFFFFIGWLPAAMTGVIAAAFAFGVLIYMRKSEYKLRSGY